MAHTAAAMYGAALFDGAIEGFLPGDPSFSFVPIFVVAGIVVVLLTVGSKLPFWMLAGLGPLGVALIAYALATTPHPGDGAALYALPVLWATVFYGRRGAVGIVGCVAVGHLIVLLELPPASSYPGRWVDVMVSVTAIAAVALVLELRGQRLFEQIVAEARTDSLTRLLNRRGFDERATLEVLHARRDDRPLAVATFDIDFFKRINDDWGHEMGDRVLAWIGETLAREARSIDVVARLGGEEFAVLLPGADAAGACEFAERVRATLAAATPAELPTVKVSVGIAAGKASADVSVILQQADLALYEAKRAGRDRAVIHRAPAAVASGLA
jgi:diguanylate cyclase (GGDEF)-like protein